MRAIRTTLFCIACTALPSSAAAEPPAVSYSAGTGHSSNIFEDANLRSDTFYDFDLGLRGSFALEETEVAFEVQQAARFYEHHDYARELATGVALEATHQFGENVKLSLRGSITRLEEGEILLALPGGDLGYRTHSYTTDIEASLAIADPLGATTLRGSYQGIRNGEAEFTVTGLAPVRLEADVEQVTGSMGYVAPFMGTEFGLTALYAETFVGDGDQVTYLRYPARRFRAAFAAGRSFGEAFSALVEAGYGRFTSDGLKGEIFTHPYFKAEGKLRLAQAVTLGLGYVHDVSLIDIDDAVAEEIDSLRLLFAADLGKYITAEIGFSQSLGEQIFYEYETRTRSLSAGLGVKLGPATTASITYTKTMREEDDPAFDYEVHEVYASVTGTL